MHREISHSDANFEQQSTTPLYLFTGLLALLLGLDLLPRLANWLGVPAWTPWPSEIAGYRFALIAAVLGGARVLYGSLQSLLEGKLGADLALAIACLAAIFMYEPLVAAEVVFIGMIGECLEAFTFGRAQRAIHKIVEVFPIRCWLLKDGQEVRVFTTELQVGDKIVVKPGAKIPADGVVVSGQSAVDASALTGESVPLDKAVGDEVLAGSLNLHGAIVMEARKVAKQTIAGQVIELTVNALKDKTNVERTADRLARLFLPLVLGLALLTFLVALGYHGWWRTPRLMMRPALLASMYPTLSVLVVACPCALILATPAAILAALGRLAGTGILIKSGSALERLAQVKAIAFDKTGTLTEGRLEIQEILPLPGRDETELLRLAASAEQYSEHPIARAVVDEAKKRGLTLEAGTDFLGFPGSGVVRNFGDKVVHVGARRFLELQNIVWSPDAIRLADQLDALGRTTIWVTVDRELLGAIGAQDRLRPEAVGVLQEFRDMGMSPIVMLTGDRASAAKSVAGDLLDLLAVHAELRPDEKTARIAELKAGGVKVAMIGDGINDAPALALADVGLAISGVDLAAEAGDVVLMGDPLRSLPMLFRLSRETVRIILQNIYWFAFAVNAVGIVATAWLWPVFAPAGWLDQSPLAAVIYHQLGSLAVLLNSMRLLWFERTRGETLFGRVHDRAARFDHWIDRAFNWHEWSHWIGTHRRGLGFCFVGLLMVGYAWIGLTVVAPDERAVVRRLGRPMATLEPGWHWRAAWPVEETTRVSDRIRVIEIGFRETPEKLGQAGSWTWTSAHRKENRRQEESMMITGDGNLVDVQLVVRFKVVDPNVYLFEVAGAEDLLRANTEMVLRGLVAGRPFHELLTVERAAFQDEVLTRLKAGSGGLGIEIEGVSLIDLHPPGEVVAEYYEVAKAMEERDRRVNSAEAEAIANLKAADAQARKIVSDAKAAANEKVKQAEAETVRFLQRSRARRQLSPHQETVLLLRSVDAILRGASQADADRELAEARRALIAQQTALGDFRDFWEMLAKSLSGRQMILIDSDRVPGQRNLFLIDPELLRPNMPIFLPPPRGPSGE